MKTILYRRWAPRRSPVKIEFPSDLIHQIRRESPSEHDRGFLFGHREGDEVRILLALRAPKADDPRHSGMEPVGSYVTRVRGEVFLTDPDLEQAARVENGVALVIAGGQAGFFVCERNGRMQAVRSYEEFSLADAAPLPVELGLLRIPAMLHYWRHPAIAPFRTWKWGAVMLATLAVPAVAFAYLRPLIPLTPLELSLRETNGQLVVSWDPALTDRAPAKIEFSDAEGQLAVYVPVGSARVTFLARGADVEVRMIAGSRSGRVHWTTANFVPTAQRSAGESKSPEETLEELEQLQLQRQWLRRHIAQRSAKAAELNAAIDRLVR
jgi:hypothetical protein